MKHLKDYKAWAIAVFGSLIILLVNLVVVPPLYRMAGAPVTIEQTFVVSGILFLVRILWFYALLLWRLLWNKE
jgi:hypothetical protein